MARLPVPGGDSGNWGSILNEYLAQVHASDGTLKTNSVTSDAIAPKAVTADLIAPNAVTASVIAPNAITNTALASNAVDAAIIKDGSITNSLIADGTIKEAKLDSAVQTKLNQAAPVTSVAAKTGDVTLAKSDVGLDQVDNTSDATKNSATATLTNKTLDSPIVTGDPIGIVASNQVESGQILKSARININPSLPDGVTDANAEVALIEGLVNDLAYADLRGGAITATTNGSPSTITYNTLADTVRPGLNAVNISLGSTSDVVAVTVDWPTDSNTLRRGFVVGITTGGLGRAGDTTIEVYDEVDTVWRTVHSVTGETAAAVWKTMNRAAWEALGGTWGSTCSKIRYTMTNFAQTGSSGLSIISLYAINSGSAMLGSQFLEKGGGNLYGSTASPPVLQAAGADTDIDLNLIPKGSGTVQVNGVDVVTTSGTQTLTNKSLTSPALSGTLKAAQSSTIEAYNTADQTTNVEKVIGQWTSNTYEISTYFAGSGTSGRSLRLGIASVAGATAGRALIINNTGPFFQFSTSTSNETSIVSIGNNNTWSATSGTQVGLTVNPTINQSSTAGYTGILVNTTETATGSGAKLLADFQVGGVSKVKIDNTGVITATAGTASGNVVTIDGTQTLTNKTLDSTSTVTLKDANFTLQDDGDATKQVQFQLSSITTGVTRTIWIPNANVTMVGDSNTQTLTNKTLTSPRIGTSILDTNGNTMMSFTPTASAVVYLNVTNQSGGGAGTGPFLSPAGPNASHSLYLQAKGNNNTSSYVALGNSGYHAFKVMNTVSAGGNLLAALPANVGGTPALTSAYSYSADANVSLDLQTKGTGTVQANGVEVATISGTQTLTSKTLTSPKITSGNAPATSTSTGTTGQIEWDASYIYVCTATDTWVRAPLASW